MSDEIQYNYLDTTKLKDGDIIVNVKTPKRPFDDFTIGKQYSYNKYVFDDKNFMCPINNRTSFELYYKNCFVTLEEYNRVMKKDYKVITEVQKDIKAGDKVLCVSEGKALSMFQEKTCKKGGVYSTFKGWGKSSYVTVPYDGGYDISNPYSPYKEYFIKLDETIGIRFKNYVKAIKSIKLNKVYRLKKT